MSSSYNLDKFSQRTLNIIASVICRQDVNVVLSSRLKEVATVVMEGRTLFLDPMFCTLYDLLLLSQLLKYRSQVSKRYRRNTLEDEVLREWLRESQGKLKKIFPKLSSVSGIFNTDFCSDSSLPKVDWKEVKLNKLEKDSFKINSSGELSSIDVPDVSITGGETDFKVLLESIENGQIPMKDYPEFPYMPVVTIPINVMVKKALPQYWEKTIEKYSHLQETVDSIKKCMTETMKGTLELNVFANHKRSGVKIDSKRLYQVPLAHKTGIPPAIFQKDKRQINTNYKPSDHLGIIVIDLNEWIEEKRLRANCKHFLSFVRVFEELEMDFMVASFRDFRIKLGNGRDVYVHIPIILKKHNEVMDSMIWSRLDHAWGNEAEAVGQVASYQPLHLLTIESYLEENIQDEGYKFVNFIYLSQNTLGGEYCQDHIYAKTTKVVEKVYERMSEELKWSSSVFVPWQLKEHGGKDIFA